MSEDSPFKYLLTTSGAAYHCKECGKELLQMKENASGGISSGVCIDHGNLGVDQMFLRLNNAYIFGNKTKFGPFIADFSLIKNEDEKK